MLSPSTAAPPTASISIDKSTFDHLARVVAWAAFGLSASLREFAATGTLSLQTKEMAADWLAFLVEIKLEEKIEHFEAVASVAAQQMLGDDPKAARLIAETLAAASAVAQAISPMDSQGTR